MTISVPVLNPYWAGQTKSYQNSKGEDIILPNTIGQGFTEKVAFEVDSWGDL